VIPAEAKAAQIILRDHAISIVGNLRVKTHLHSGNATGRDGRGGGDRSTRRGADKGGALAQPTTNTSQRHMEM